VAGDGPVSREGVHHPGVGCDREGATEKHRTYNNHLQEWNGLDEVNAKEEKTDHEHDRAVLADRVEENLSDGLSSSRTDSRVVILHGEEQAEDEEPTEDSGYPCREV
jgi:hypothetical protein